MDFGSLPPELNSANMYSGPGSGSLLAAAAAWDSLSVELQSAADTVQSTLTGLTATAWLGPSSAAMAAAAEPYVAWLGTTAAQAEQTAAQAKLAAAAYEAAFAMTVPPPVVVANRSLVMSLIATNLLGQNSPAIAAAEADYLEMWAQDAAAMYGYAGQSAAATVLTPFVPPSCIADPAGPVGHTVATGAQSVASLSAKLLSTTPAALQELAQPLQSATGLSGILDALGFTSVQSFFTLGNAVVPYTATMTTVNMGIGAAHYSQWPAAAGAALAAQAASGAGALTSVGPAGLAGLVSPVASPVTAAVGQGAAVGGLSVPTGWASAAPQMHLAARALPMAGGAPTALSAGSGALVGDLALAGMAGRALAGPAGLSRREQGEVAPTSWTPGVPMTGIVDQLQKLADLHSAHALTDEEFATLKGRLIGSRA